MSLLHRPFEASFRIAKRLFEHRRTAHRRRHDYTAAMNGADNRKTRGDGDGPFRPRPVHSRDDESRIRQRRNIDKGRHRPTSAIRTQAVIDASLSTVHLWAIQINYDDYYTRQVGWTLPYFTGARAQSGTCLDVCLMVSSDRLSLWSDEAQSLWGSVRWRLERRLQARTPRRRQNEGQLLPEEIWCKASSTHHRLPVNEWSV